MSEARFVTIKKVRDPVEAEMLVDLLEQEGIPANAPGAAQAAHFGNLAAQVMQVPLQVLERDAERARAIIDALEDFDEVVPEDRFVPEMDERDGPYRGGIAEEGKPRRNRVTAMSAAIVLPMILGIFGAGHFYAREWSTGFLLLAIAWLCIIGSMMVHPYLVLGLPLVLLFDIFGAMRAIGAPDR